MPETFRGPAIISRGQARDGKWKIEDVTLRPIGDEELVVQIVASGICHTDLVVGDQPDGAAPFVFYPRVLGHEGTLSYFDILHPVEGHTAS